MERKQRVIWNCGALPLSPGLVDVVTQMDNPIVLVLSGRVSVGIEVSVGCARFSDLIISLQATLVFAHENCCKRTQQS